MKSFSKFIKEKAQPIIDFRYVNLPIPIIDFRNVNKKVKSIKENYSADPYDTWGDVDDNSHLGYDNATKSRMLESIRKIHNHPFDGSNDQHIHAVRKYTNSSFPINNDLIRGKPNREESVVSHLDKFTRHPIGAELSVYSGINGPFGKTFSVGKKVHLPAFTSTTHSKDVSDNFTHPDEHGEEHVIHIHMKPSDHGFHVGYHSTEIGEHETILPRNTTLKIDKHTELRKPSGRIVNLWHAHIHKQEK